MHGSQCKTTKHKKRCYTLNHILTYTVRVGDFNTPLCRVVRSQRQKHKNVGVIGHTSSRPRRHLQNTPPKRIYFLWSGFHKTFSKVNRIQGHKANLNRHKKTETTPCVLSIQTYGTWTTHYQIKERRQTSRKKLKTFWNWKEMKIQHLQTYGTQGRQF